MNRALLLLALVALGAGPASAGSPSAGPPSAGPPSAGPPSAGRQEGETPDVDALKAQLRDQSDKTDFLGYRARAVKKLAELGTEEAWELVLGALTDIAPRVCDEAQLRLGELDDPELVEDLLLGREGLRAKDNWVRLRVAEALGRIPAPVEAVPLAKALGDDDPAVRRAVCWTVERRAAAGRAFPDGSRKLERALDKALRHDRDPLVRGAALLALDVLSSAEGALAPAYRAPAALDDDEEAVRAAAVEAVASGQGSALLLVEAASDSSFRVRTRAALALAERGDAEAARALAARLAAEPEVRLRWRLVEALQSMSGLKHRQDARPWQAWAAGLPEEWRADDSRSEGAGGGAAGTRDLGDRTVAFAGLSILSGRVAFLVDFSGSLWKQREDGRSRKQVVDEELRRALEALPPETLFNVIPYTDVPHPWEEELVSATPKNVARAIEAFESCRQQGKGNVFDAFELALSDPAVDTIVVLTDGAPSGGRRWNLDLMVELLTEENRYRQVTFDAVLVDAPKHLQKRWVELARRTGGRTVVFELD